MIDCYNFINKTFSLEINEIHLKLLLIEIINLFTITSFI